MISAILDCRCGSSPRLVTRASKRWYQCFACGTAGPKVETIPAAAAAWNADREFERKQS